jgi:hypothetical protein
LRHSILELEFRRPESFVINHMRSELCVPRSMQLWLVCSEVLPLLALRSARITEKDATRGVPSALQKTRVCENVVEQRA